jgi:regulator of sigma E protease
MQTLLFIIGILLFIGLVVVHEFGHFLAARRNGVKVEEFGLGFPPRAKGKKLKSGMILSLNWLPLGGFVKLKGEHDADTAPHSFGAASYGAKSRILLAGIFMNLLVGFLMLTILALISLPKLINPETVGQSQFTVASDEHQVSSRTMIAQVLPDSPAAAAGLQDRDIIRSVSSPDKTFTISKASDLRPATSGLAGKTVIIEIKRGNQNLTKTATLLTKDAVETSQNTDNPKAYLGVTPVGLEVVRYTWSAPIVALGFTKQLTVLTAKGLWQAIQGFGGTVAGLVTHNHEARENGQTAASSQVGGPVAIVKAIWNSGDLGIIFMLMFIAIISLSLALINILPIPALDGGRLFMITAARLSGKPLTAGVEEALNAAGMAFILILVVLITIVDVQR